MSVALLLSPRSSEGPRIVGPFDDPDDAIGYLAGLCLESPEYQVTWSIVPITDPDPSKDQRLALLTEFVAWLEEMQLKREGLISVGQYDVNEFIARSTGSDETPDPAPGFTPRNCSWCSNPILHARDVEATPGTDRVHHAGLCPSPPGSQFPPRR